MFADGDLHGAGELVKTLVGHGDEKFVFILKVAIRGVVGNACAARQFAQRERLGSGFGDQMQGGVEIVIGNGRIDLSLPIRSR